MKFTIKQDDRDIEINLDGKSLGTFTYDECGSAGTEAVESIVKAIAKKIKAEVESK